MLAFSEEVLVTKSDLDEKTSQMSDLTNKVEEMRTHHGYQMRLKDKDLKDKITLLTDKFTAEIEGEKQRYETLAAEKNDMEMEYEDRIKNTEERHAAATQQTEAQYQHKIMAEVGRYQQLMEEKELLNERWDEQNSLLVESHERLVQELADEYEYKLQEEQLACGWGSVEAVVVNPDFILGAWDVKPTSGQLIVTMAQRFVPFYPRGGKCIQHVRDCADGHILAMERGVPGRRYLLGNENLSYREFMTMVGEVVGTRPPVVPLPNLAIGLAGRVGEIGSRFDAHRFAGLNPHVLRSMQQPRYRSADRAHSELGVPQTPVVEAIEEAYRWFVDHGYC